MDRTPINPVPWSIELGFDQAELIQGHQRLLVCSAQDAVGADGAPQHPGDMAAQIELSLDNLEAVLTAADMTLANVVRLNMYTTDVDELFKNNAIIMDDEARTSSAAFAPRSARHQSPGRRGPSGGLRCSGHHYNPRRTTFPRFAAAVPCVQPGRR